MTPEDAALARLSEPETKRYHLPPVTNTEASITHTNEYMAQSDRLNYITPDIVLAAAKYIVLLKFTGRA